MRAAGATARLCRALPSRESRKEHRKEPRRGRPRWQRWCATNNNRTHKLLCNYFKILRRVYAAIRRASRDGTYSRDVQSLSSPLLLPPPPLFREFPFSFSFRGRLPPETGLWGESINCRSCARASLFKKQKERKGKSLSSHLLNGRGGEMRRGVLARGGIRISNPFSLSLSLFRYEKFYEILSLSLSFSIDNIPSTCFDPTSLFVFSFATMNKSLEVSRSIEFS